MPGLSLLSIFVSRLEKLEVPYAVTGAVASIIYGEPRLTNDVDVIIMMQAQDIEKFVQAFPAMEFYCPPAEVLRIEMRRSRRGHFNLIHHETGTKADIYLAGEDELHRWALSKRRDLVVEGERVKVAPPEYVIVRKLEYYREGGSEKHLRDIAGMLELSSHEIDFNQLEEFIHRYGLEREWQEAKTLAGS
jgi:hypothetical protein